MKSSLLVGSWLSWAALTGVLLFVRVRSALIDGTAGWDFTRFYLPAARAVAEGRSPYDVVGYVYSPLIALVLAPFAGSPHVRLGWLISMAVCCVVIVAAMTATVSRRLTWWQRPVVAAGISVTLLWNWPMTLEFWMAQTDVLVLTGLVLASYAGERSRAGAGGAMLVLVGLVKTWPAGVAVWALRRGAPHRVREIVAMLISSALALGVLVVLLGPQVVPRWARATLEASDQPLVVFSVWGLSDRVFGGPEAVEPLIDAPWLAGPATIAALAAILVLVIITLRSPGAPALSIWHVSLAVVLVLPVSHLPYLLLGLPILWVWAARLLANGGRRRRDWVMCAIAGGWWLVTFRIIWAGDSWGTLSTTGFVLMLVSSIVMLAASVVIEAGLCDRRTSAVELPRAQVSA